MKIQRDNKGIALVITLLVLTLLIVLILEFNSGMRVEARAAANFRDDIKAYYLAKSGVTFAIAVLEDDDKTAQNFDALNENWAQKLPPIPFGDGFVTVEITDENSRINVNKMSTGFGSVNSDNMRALMGRFLKQFELEEDIANAIADWTDQDDFERMPGGAEDNYYGGLEDSYEAKNKPFDSLQELRLVKGLEGETYNKLHKFLTVHSDGWINVNTAGKEVIISLSDNLSAEIADEIIAFRSENPFQTKLDFKNNISISEDVYNEIGKFIDVKSNYFSITSSGNVNQSQKTIRAEIMRQNNKTKIVYWRVE